MNTSSQQARTTRQEMLARVHAALGHAQTVAPSQPPPGVEEGLSRLVRSGDDLAGRFEKRATEVGMKVQHVAAAELVRQIGALLAGLSAKRVVMSVGTVPQALGLKDSLRRQGLEVVDWNATPGLESQYDTDVGVTDVHAAIAESGTLVCQSDAGHSRGLSLVPPVHIAVVRKSDILPDLIDFWARMAALPNEGWSSSIVLITGPSKTADIEGVLVTGVHGPGQVFILLVEDA